MKVKNYSKQTIWILLTTIVLMYFVSFINIEAEFWGLELRQVDIISDLKQPSDDEMYLEGEEYDTDDSSLLEQENKPYVKASFAIADGISTLAEKVSEANDDYLMATNPGVPQGRVIELTGDTKQLKYFFDALKHTKRQKVRIAHFGDSAIEGDLVTADIRQELQKKFGGTGVGWLSMTSQDTQFRMTTKHTFSSNWEDASLYGSNPRRYDLGISGEVFIPKGEAWVQYNTTRRYRDLKYFKEVRLFYSDAKGGEVEYKFDSGKKGKEKLRSGKGVYEIEMNAGKNSQEIRIDIPKGTDAHFYGVSLESGNGLYVDNLPLRGNSGVDLQEIPLNMLKEFNQLLNYKLIILEFGLNAAGSIKSNYTWYEREMIQVVNHFKKAFPDVSIIMISAHDKSVKRGTNFVTDPAVEHLVVSQEKIAKKAGVAFWNMFEAMGGKNSMPKWVEANPPLAFRDYTHFNDYGAKKIAELFTESLLQAYKK